MKAFRDALGFWNETGLLISLLLMCGYFGSRGMLGWLPLFVAALLVLGSIVLSWLLASAQQPTEETDFYDRPRHSVLDRFMLYFGLFVWGVVLFVYLGAIV